MAMTAAVKDELSRVTVTRPSARQAEIATMLRFAGALHLVGGHIVVEAELDTGSVARRLRKEIAEIFGHGSEVQIVAGGGLRKGSRYLVRVTKDGEGLARQTGPGRPARPSGARPAAPRRVRRHRRRGGGLARRVPGPRLADRAGPGLLAGDHLPVDRGGAGPGRRRSAARRVGQGARGPRRRTGSSSATATRSARCSPVSARTRACWPGRSAGCAARCGRPRTGWPTSTTRTCAARPGPRWPPGARVERALEILGDDAPDHLLQAGRLRLEHKQASLEELGALLGPADDQGRGGRPDPAPARDGRQAGRRARHSGHRVRRDPGDARAITRQTAFGLGHLRPAPVPADPASLTDQAWDNAPMTTKKRKRVTGG